MDKLDYLIKYLLEENRNIDIEEIPKDSKEKQKLYRIISFLNLYEKVKRNAPDLRQPTKDEQIRIAKAFYEIGKQNNMVIYSCCENSYLVQYGLNCEGCRSQSLVEKLFFYLELKSKW